MFHDMGKVALKSGEHVSMGVVAAPDLEWAERVERMLQHKGDPWAWQNTTLLRADCGLEAYFYILHRDGRPFANVMTVELEGVGIFGHVWTDPADRRKGASSILVRAQMDDFRRRDGRALILQTGYDTAPYRIYQGFGFEGIEPRSDYMAWYADSGAAFDAEYFADSPVEIETPSWRHWPAMPPLFIGDFPGTVRCVTLGMLGRASTEASFLRVLQEAGSGGAVRASVLRSNRSNAVVGLAAWTMHPLWPIACAVDVYCHPDYWKHAPELLESLALPTTERCVAYCDPACPEKRKLLKAAGYHEVAMLPRWVSIDAAKTAYTDVTVLEKG